MEKRKRKILQIYKENFVAVKKILNKWDILNVVPDGINDEYDPLINSIISVLPQNPPVQALGNIIYNLLTCDYGLPGSIKTDDISKKILEWWDKSKQIILEDYINVKKGDKLIIKIISFAEKSETHEFYLNINDQKNHYWLKINEKKYKGLKFNIWTFPKEGSEISIVKDCSIRISPRGSRIWNWFMRVEKKGNSRTYYCNASDEKEKFDDLIFEIKLVSSKQISN